MAKADLNKVFNGWSGKMGGLTFSQTKQGTVVKQVQTPANPRTAPQVAACARLRAASTSYATLTPAQVTKWNLYALSVEKFDKRNETTYHPTAFNAYLGLACKFLQVTPGGTISNTPPTTGFGGDGIQITCTGGAGKLSLSANAANAPGVVTEILVQPLKNANRKPQIRQYRSKVFISFAPPTTLAVTLPAGIYAVAIRFVSSATGQETVIVPLGVYTVS